MPIRVQCPTCRSTGRVPDAAMNRAVLCPACRTKYRLGPQFVVPDEPVARGAPAARPSGPGGTPVGSTRGGVAGAYGVAEDRPAALPRSRRPEPAGAAGTPSAPTRSSPEPPKPRRTKAPKADRGGIPAMSLGEARAAFKLVFALAFVGIVAVAVYRVVQDANPQPGPADAPELADDRGDPGPLAGPARQDEGGGGLIASSGPMVPGGEARPTGPAPARGTAGAGDVPGSGLLGDRFPEGKPGRRAHERADAVGPAERKVAASMAWVGGKLGGGTGFLVREGLVATTTRAIVFDFLQDVKVWFPEAQGEARGPFPVALVAYDRERDVALLAVLNQGKPLPPPFEGTADSPPSPGTPGKLLHVKGPAEANPVDSRLVSFGPSPEGRRARVAASLDAALRTSEVGGPLIDSEGRAIGMATLAQGPGRPATFILVGGQHNLIDSNKRSGEDDFSYAQDLHRLIATIRRLMMAMSLYASALDLRARCLEIDDESITIDGASYFLPDYLDRVRRIDHELFFELEGELNRIRGYSDSRLRGAERAKLALAAGVVHRMREALREEGGDPKAFAEKVRSLRGEMGDVIREYSVRADVEGPDFLWPALKGEGHIDPEEFHAGIVNWIR